MSTSIWATAGAHRHSTDSSTHVRGGGQQQRVSTGTGLRVAPTTACHMLPEPLRAAHHWAACVLLAAGACRI